MKRLWQVLGCLVSLCGVAALIEAQRLQQYRAAFGIGANTFPLLLGAALVVTGIYLVVTANRAPIAELKWPHGRPRAVLISTIVALVVYCASIPILGYYSATVLVSIALFRLIGGFNWLRSFASAAITTACLYGIFRILAGMQLPPGVIG